MEATDQRVSPENHHVKGEHKEVADALSHIYIKEDDNTSSQEMAYCMSRLTRSEAIEVTEPTSPQDMATCLAGSEDVEFEQVPNETSAHSTRTSEGQEASKEDKGVSARLHQNEG
jgi:hypothetical protein